MYKTCATAIVISVLFIALVAVYVIIKRGKYTSATTAGILGQISQNLGRMDPSLAQIPLYEGVRSETINKSEIYLCLRDPHTGMYYDMNTLMYVALHEVAHVKSKTFVTEHEGKGHRDNAEFQAVFNQLLARAMTLGIYDPTLPQPAVYCGVVNH